MTQLMPMREYAATHGWTVVREYVDKASVRDLARRTAWRQLLDDAAKRRFDVVLVWKLDRAFRSVADMHRTLAVWEPLGISFQSVRDHLETATAAGRLMMNILATFAEFERDLISERVRAGMDRARRQGKHVGRPRLFALSSEPARLIERVRAGELSQRRAARKLGVSARTFGRMLQKGASAEPRLDAANSSVGHVA